MSTHETINLTGTVTPENQGSLVDVNEELHKTSEAIKQQGRTPENVLRALALVTKMGDIVKQEKQEIKKIHVDFSKFEELERIENIREGVSNINFLAPDSLIFSLKHLTDDKELLYSMKLDDSQTVARMLNPSGGALSVSPGLDFMDASQSEFLVYGGSDGLRVLDCRKKGEENLVYLPLNGIACKFAISLDDEEVITNDEDGFQIIHGVHPFVSRKSVRSKDLITDSIGRIECGVKLKNGKIAFGTAEGGLVVYDIGNNSMLRVRVDNILPKYSLISLAEYDDNKVRGVYLRVGTTTAKFVNFDTETGEAIPCGDASFTASTMMPLENGLIAFASGYNISIVNGETNKLVTLLKGKKNGRSTGKIDQRITGMTRLPDGRIVVCREDGNIVFYGDPDVSE